MRLDTHRLDCYRCGLLMCESLCLLAERSRLAEDTLHWLASPRYSNDFGRSFQVCPFSTSFGEVPSELKRVGSDDVATSKPLIGSRVFCQRVRAAHGEKPCNRSTSWFIWKDAKGIFAVDKTPKSKPFCLW